MRVLFILKSTIKERANANYNQSKSNFLHVPVIITADFSCAAPPAFQIAANLSLKGTPKETELYAFLLICAAIVLIGNQISIESPRCR